MKQIQDAYIVAATRLPVAKRNGMFRNVRPDYLQNWLDNLANYEYAEAQL